jgi:peptidoglycan hydrolase-like protein with peptidoglycan-binding domain
MHSLSRAFALTTLAVLPLSLIVADTATTKPGSKETSTKKATTATVRKRTTSAKGRTPSHYTPRQVQPTPERYREIQQALASKGYLKTGPTGSWDQDSMDALRRFQEDQKINPSGKIDSLSLIALGLGPKRATSPAVARPAEPKPQSAPPAAN